MDKRLPHSNALRQVKPLKKISSQQLLTHQANHIKSFLIQALLMLKVLLMLIHTLSNTKDLKTSLPLEIALELTPLELNLQPSIKPQLLSTT